MKILRSHSLHNMLWSELDFEIFSVFSCVCIYKACYMLRSYPPPLFDCPIVLSEYYNSGSYMRSLLILVCPKPK
jgi:hypothetical protein